MIKAKLLAICVCWIALLIACSSFQTESFLVDGEQRICHNPINLDGVPDFFAVTDVWFVDNDTIGISGWQHIIGGDNATYTRQSKLDSSTEQFEFSATDFQANYPVPCQTCDYDVFEESPDGSWQVIKVNDGREKGVWLIGEEQSFQIVDYIPYSSTWTWAEDSSLLWITYSHQEHGLEKGIIQLEPAFQTNFNIEKSMPLEPISAYYNYAFSPIDKKLLSTSGAGGVLTPDNDDLYTFDFSEDLDGIDRIETLDGLERVEWDQALGGFLFLLVKDKSIQVESQEEHLVYILPSSTIEDILMEPIPDADERKLYPLFNFYSIAPAKDKLIVNPSYSEIVLLECE